MRLSDLIIEHGPYTAGELSPFAHGVDYAQLNELREELLAARKASEERERFEVVGLGYDDHDVVVTCRTCGSWDAKLDAWTGLADLNRRAGEHAEVCG